MVRRRIVRNRRVGVLAWFGVGIGLLAICTLLFVRSAARHAFENDQMKLEMMTVLQRLDGVESSLDRIHRFSLSFDHLTKDNVAEVKDKTGLDDDEDGGDSFLGRSMSYFEQIRIWNRNDPLAGDGYVQVLDRVNELTVNANLIAQRIENLTGVIESRREMLSAIPSVVPVLGRLTSNYGPRRSPFTGKIALHKGIDIAAEVGTPVLAPADGIVTYIGRGRTYGLTVVVNHGYGIMTKYAHNSEIVVHKGQRLKRGQVIAKLGNSGRSTGPHLHYEVWINGQSVDPTRFLLDDATNRMLAKMKPGAEVEDVDQSVTMEPHPGEDDGDVGVTSESFATMEWADAATQKATDIAAKVGLTPGVELAAKAGITEEGIGKEGVGGDFDSVEDAQFQPRQPPEWDLYINIAIVGLICLMAGGFLYVMKLNPRRLS